jgi:tetratricopeptide (TPR) repeat protein
MAPRLGLLALLIAASASGQTPAPSSAAGQPPGLRQLTGDDEKRAKQLDEQVDKAMKEHRWSEAISKAEELLALMTRVQGAKHFDAVDAAWQVKTLRRVAALPKDDRAAFLSASATTGQADSLQGKGKYRETQPLYEKALEIRRRLLGDDHPVTATSYNKLAYNLAMQGKAAAAQPLYEKALEIRRRLLGDDHPRIATSYNNLAESLAAQGRFVAAQPLYEKALEIHRRLLSDYDTDTAVSYNNLAMNLHAQGKYAAAEPLLEKALEINRRLLSDDHPDTADSYGNLAMNLAGQGKYAAARPLFEKALEIHRRLLSDDHPHTATSCNNLASNLMYEGKFDEAQPLLAKALEINRRLLGDDHPHTATSYNNLAMSLKGQGRFASAEPLCEKALEIRRRLLSDDHPHTAQSYNNLAMNLMEQGKQSAAQPLLEKALEIRHRLLGDDHPGTAEISRNLAFNLMDQGRYTEARDHLIREARSFEVSRLQAGITGLDRATATTRADPLLVLTSVLARLGQPTEAWQRLEQDLGRGLLDELAARRDRRLTPEERAQLGQLVADLERLDRLFEVPMERLDQTERRKRLDDLRQQHDLVQIALGELRSQLAQRYGPLGGKVAASHEIQSALPRDTALVAWVDLKPPGPNVAGPSGDHWGVVVRAKGIPFWTRLQGSGKDRLWTEEDTKLPGLVRDVIGPNPTLTLVANS